MNARVGVLMFPGTNCEDETVRACRTVGIDAHLLHWTADLTLLSTFDGYVLPGGFAYEDRVRAGAIAAHERMMSAVRAGADAGKLVLGICNGAQILMEAALVGTFDGATRPQAGFARNAPSGRYRSTPVHVKLAIPPDVCAITAALAPGTVIPAWASHAEGRLAADARILQRLHDENRVAFTYCDALGRHNAEATPNGSALDAAAVTNERGNVLAMMPHPERAAWTYMTSGLHREAARGDAARMLAPADGLKLFASFARALSR